MKHTITLTAAFLILTFSNLSLAGINPSRVSITRDGPDPSQPGVGFMVEVEVAVNGTPTGDIEITDGTSSCTIILPLKACMFKTDQSGTNIQLVAHYSGDAQFAPSSSGHEPHTIAPASLPEKVTVGQGGVQAGLALSGGSMNVGGISSDNRFFLFDSVEQLTVDDLNVYRDVYVFDRIDQKLELISRGLGNTPGNADSRVGSISAGGRYVAFTSLATNLINVVDDNNSFDAFLFDRQTGTTQLISQTPDQIIGNDTSFGAKISGNGLWVSFVSQASNLTPEGGQQLKLMLYDVVNQTIALASPGGGSLTNQGLSYDGNLLLFTTDSANLINNDTNGVTDLFLYERTQDSTIRVSVDDTGNQLSDPTDSGAISGNGQYVVFYTASPVVSGDANNKFDVFRHHLASGSIDWVSLNSNGNELSGISGLPTVSFNGDRVAFTTDSANADDMADTNELFDIFIKNMNTGMLTRASMTLDQMIPEHGRGSSTSIISADGQWLLYESSASITGTVRNLKYSTRRQAFIYDVVGQETLWPGALLLGEQGNGHAADIESQRNLINSPAIPNTDGSSVIFGTEASNLTETPLNGAFWPFTLYRRDRTLDHTELLLINQSGEPANDNIDEYNASSDGRFVVFTTESTNLDALNTPAFFQSDAFVYDSLDQSIEWVSQDPNGNETDQAINNVDISDDGNWVVWTSAGNYVADPDTNDSEDVFLLNRITGGITRVSQDAMGAAGSDSAEFSRVADDGSLVTFFTASALIPSDTNGQSDVYGFNVNSGDLEIISLADDEQAGNSNSTFAPEISQDGRYVLFLSEASNLVMNDSNGFFDWFIRDRLLGTTTLVSQDNLGGQATGVDFSDLGSNACMSANGRFVVHHNTGYPGDEGAGSPVYVRDVFNGITQALAHPETGDLLRDVPVNSGCMNQDGHYIVLYYGNDDLAAGDSNGKGDQFIFINPLLNEAPVAVSDHYHTLEDVPLNIPESSPNNILSNDNDPDGDSIFIENPSQLSNLAGLKGLLVVEPNGALTYTPSLNNSGSGSVEYTVTDGMEVSGVASIQIEVIPVNDQPVIAVTETTINTTAASGLVTVENWASFYPGAFDEFEQTPQFMIINVSDPTQFITPPQVNQSGDLFYETSTTATQPVTFDVFVQDDGGTDNGGVDTSASISISLVLDTDIIFESGFE